jgi:hypothetical protein
MFGAFVPRKSKCIRSIEWDCSIAPQEVYVLRDSAESSRAFPSLENISVTFSEGGKRRRVRSVEWAVMGKRLKSA